MIELLFGTGNQAKFEFLRQSLAPLPVRLLSLRDMPFPPPEPQETGNSPLENAREKARLYFKAYGIPVFSCDSGLYFENVPDEAQPGVHVRRPQGKNLSDEEMLAWYAALAQKYGGERGILTAKYKNAVCLILNARTTFENADESLSGEAFFLSSIPHRMRVMGFPLDSLSMDIKSGKYYYDLTEPSAEGNAVPGDGFRRFFENCLREGTLPAQDGGEVRE